MRANLNFILPEETNDFALFSSAPKLFSVIHNTLNELRKKIRDDNTPALTVKILERVRDKILEEIKNEQVTNLFN